MHSYLSGLGAALCVALLVSCGDSPVVPTPQGQGSTQPLNASITLTPDSAAGWVPEAITIRVQISGPDADSLRKLPVWWSSADPNLVALAKMTDTAVIAIPKHDGVAQVIATVGDVADTARLVCWEEGALLTSTLVVSSYNYFGSPAIASDGTIITFGDFSERPVLAFDRAFAPLWTYPGSGAYRNAAITDDGNVFLPGTRMTVLTSAGALVWEDSTVYNIDAAPAIDGRGDVWFAGYLWDDGSAVAHYDANGLVAATPLPTGFGPIHLPPVIVGDSVVVVGSNDRLAGISLADSILWVDTLPDSSYQRLGFFPPSVAGDGRTAYFPTRQGPVVAVDGLTGAVNWTWHDSHQAVTWYALTPIVDSDGTIYVQTIQTLVALTSDGAVRWQADSLGGDHSVTGGGAPALAGGGVLYVACQLDLCAVNTADGSVRWRRPLPVDGLAGAILILPDSSLVFQTVTVGNTRLSYLMKLRGRYPLADAPWPVDGGDLRRTRRGHMP